MLLQTGMPQPVIVTQVEQGWEIVFQPSHGLLAGQLADALHPDHRCHFWFETRAAITQHDDEQPEFNSSENNYVTEVGAPRDFTLVQMSAAERFQKVEAGLRHAYRKSRWMGLLRSTHEATLYEGQPVSESLQQLLEQERQHRRKVQRQLKVRKQDLDAAYEIMHWCDRCSLILCQQQLPAMQRHLEILTTSAGQRSEIWQDEDNVVHIDPWPFQADELQVGVEVYLLNRLQFLNDRQLGEELGRCTPEYRRWILRAE